MPHDARETVNCAVPNRVSGPLPIAVKAGSVLRPSCSVGASKHFAKCLDGATIRIGSALEVPREGAFMLEREVYHAVACLRPRPQAVEIIESSTKDLCPGRNKRSGRGVRAGEADHLMARA